MKTNNDLTTEVQIADGVLENQFSKKGTDQVGSVMPGLNRFIEDLRTGYRSGSRIDVQIDWAKGRMAISH